jgi:hypothetical protein
MSLTRCLVVQMTYKSPIGVGSYFLVLDAMFSPQHYYLSSHAPNVAVHGKHRIPGRSREHVVRTSASDPTAPKESTTKEAMIIFLNNKMGQGRRQLFRLLKVMEQIPRLTLRSTITCTVMTVFVSVLAFWRAVAAGL